MLSYCNIFSIKFPFWIAPNKVLQYLQFRGRRGTSHACNLVIKQPIQKSVQLFTRTSKQIGKTYEVKKSA